MSIKIGHKHEHARDQWGTKICHHAQCFCARCILEQGKAIPKDRRAQIEEYRESVSEMYKCTKCGGLKVSLLDADTHATYKIPATLWCMTCGNTMLPDPNQETVRQRMADTKVVTGPSLRERMAGAKVPDPTPAPDPRYRPEPEPEARTKGRGWSPEERQDLKVLIDKHGVTAGSRAYVAKYPDRGRTEQGCAYQWNTAISKNKGLK